MGAPFDVDVSGYSWLEDEGGLINKASCFTFVPIAASRSVLSAKPLRDVRELDLTGTENAVDVMVADLDLNTAVFNGGNDWTVIYQHNCSPYDFANGLLSDNTVEQGVVVFWNVNSDAEFSLWQQGSQVVTFQDAYERSGSNPDQLNDSLIALNIPLTEPSYDDVENGDDWFATYPQLMALAETITGVHLDENFLARSLQVGRIPQ